MKNNTFNPWIKISSLSCLEGKERNVEMSSDFHFRSCITDFKNPEIIEGLPFPEPRKIFTEVNILTPEQQTLLKDKISGVDFKMLKDMYVDINVDDGVSTTFDITEENFSKRIIIDFELEDVEYEPLARLIDYIYNLCYTEK